MDNNTDKTKLTEAEMEQVKGGPAYLKLGDIKGEAMATDDKHNKWSDILSVGFRRR